MTVDGLPQETPLAESQRRPVVFRCAGEIIGRGPASMMPTVMGQAYTLESERFYGGRKRFRTIGVEAFGVDTGEAGIRTFDAGDILVDLVEIDL